MENSPLVLENSINLLLQPKGGVGKTFSGSLLAQWISSRFPGTLVAYDGDQENTTFAQHKAYNARHINVMKDDSHVVDSKKFDPWMVDLLAQKGNVVIDTGANSFSPTLAYLVENDVFGLWKEEGKKVYIHTVVGGGDVYQDTAEGFSDIANVSDFPIVVWENEHFGKLQTESGKHFTETSVFKSVSKRIIGRVVLHSRNPDTFGRDIKKMTTARLTLDEVMQDERFDLMEKRRLKQVVNDVFTQLDAVEW